MTAPQLWIIAGPNGAGKTTLTGDKPAGRVPVVNPDDIARSLDPNHNGNPTVMLKAGREAIGLRAAYLAARQTFAVETLAITHTRPARVHIPAECQSDGAYRAT
jgi:predicted ABC-type ATPase